MLRSFEEVCQTTCADLMIAANNEHAAVAGGGEYVRSWHWHDCLMFILPSRGTIELKDENHRSGTWLSQDRFAVVPAGQPHETRAGIGGHSHIAVYVTGSAIERLDKESGSLSEFRRRARSTALFRRSARLRALQDLSVQLDAGAYGNSRIRQDLSSALLVQCIADVIAGESVSGTSHREHAMMLIEELKDYLTRHADRSIPLDLLEERFGVSRRHMTRLFREFTGESIGEFQQRVRLDTACELLRATDLPVGEIAFRVGFDSGTALAHAMGRRDGRSPSDVRTQMARSVKNQGPLKRAPR